LTDAENSETQQPRYKMQSDVRMHPQKQSKLVIFSVKELH